MEELFSFSAHIKGLFYFVAILFLLPYFFLAFCSSFLLFNLVAVEKLYRVLFLEVCFFFSLMEKKVGYRI